MSESSLLERLLNPRLEEERRTSVDFDRLVESVRRNLTSMLNSRRGGVPIQADYGAPEFSTVVYTMPRSLSAFQQAIKTSVEKYEPRLRNVRVNFEKSEEHELLLHFAITGEVISGGERAILTLDTLVDSSGRISVED